MIFPADHPDQDKARPSALHRAAAALCEANLWTTVNGVAVARVYRGVGEEIEAARARGGLVDLGALKRFIARGPEAATAIARLSSAPAARLAPGESGRGLILDEAGGAIDLIEIARLDEDLFLATTTRAHPRALQLAARGVRAAFEDLSASVAALGVIGPDAEHVLEKAGVDRMLAANAGAARVRGVETAARPLQFAPAPGFEMIFPAEEALTVWDRIRRRADIGPVGLDALEVMRIEAGAPRPLVDFATGEESVERTPSALGLAHLAPLDAGWFAGRPALRAGAASQTRLVTLTIDADAVAPAATVKAKSRRIGALTSAAWSPTRRRVVAFARVKRGASLAALAVETPEGGAPARLLETAESALLADFEENA